MGVRIKQTANEVFKLFTEVHSSEGSIPGLSCGKDCFYSGTNPLGSESERTEVFVPPVFLCGITSTASLPASVQGHRAGGY